VPNDEPTNREMVLFPVANIVAEGRHRREIEDGEHPLGRLVESIGRVGLLHPLIIRPDGRLIAGERRLAAVKGLGWERVPCTVARDLTTALQLLQAEADENACRKPLTPSEAVALAEALEPLAAADAKRRQEASHLNGRQPGGTPRRKRRGVGGGNLPPPKPPKTRDQLGAAVGMGGRTLQKARAVVDAARQDPGAHGDLVEGMDASGKVDPAWRELRRRQGRTPTPGVRSLAGIAQVLGGLRQKVERLVSSPDGFDPGDAERVRAECQGILALLPHDTEAEAP